jgi:ABC-2 type transport system ATP-binding protein
MAGMNAPETPSAGIELHDLVKSFGPVAAVRGISLAIAPGETVALLGANGAGKSTTIDMLLGLLAPDHGSVSLFGLTPRQAIDAGEVGAMLQTGALIRDLSVRELITTIASLSPHPVAVDEVLELTGTSDIAGRRTQKLSGGQTQRVRFAMALVGRPSLLVLDEPTVAMDVEARHGFWVTMRACAARGTTVVFATHYLDEADAYADRVVLMANGRVVADGAAAEIKARVRRRTIRAVVPGTPLGALAVLPGVTHADVDRDAVVLTCADSDAALRALVHAHPEARDIDVRGAGLEEAFLQLTADADDATHMEVAR